QWSAKNQGTEAGWVPRFPSGLKRQSVSCEIRFQTGPGIPPSHLLLCMFRKPRIELAHSPQPAIILCSAGAPTLLSPLARLTSLLLGPFAAIWSEPIPARAHL